MTGRSATAASPFHAGERQAQARMGVVGIEAWARKVIRPFMPDQHRQFFRELPFLAVAGRDREDRPWATVLAGDDGFIASPDRKRLSIRAAPAVGDALAGALTEGADIGLLGIDFAARRRNRVNGRIVAATARGLEFVVDQSFGNCPQHINDRSWRRAQPAPGPVLRGGGLTDRQRARIAAADTFFIASGHIGADETDTGRAAAGLDVSHRGGPSGFVAVETANRIRFPDYGGNKHFNTVGNLLLDDRVGLLFVDFQTGGLLQLTGRARIDWAPSADAARAGAATAGAERLIAIDIEAVVEQPGALALRWDGDPTAGLALRLAERVRETADVVSFHFAAADGGPLPDFRPGQHLPIELAIPGVAVPTARTYTISGRTASGGYRISVKRKADGLASRFLHDALTPGMTIPARPPAGDFAAPPADRPLLLISAGIGATPMLAHLQTAGGRRPVWHIHGARNGATHVFREEARELAGRRPEVRLLTAYSRPAPRDRRGVDYDLSGRLTARRDFLAAVGTTNVDVLLCGPQAFVADLADSLVRQGVAAGQVGTESFG